MGEIKNENSYTIHGFMINELGLRATALNVYAIIFGFSQDGQSMYYGSRKYLAEFIGVSRPTIDKALEELCEKNFIIKICEENNHIINNKYKVNLDMLNSIKGCKETLQGGQISLQGYKETLPNNKDNLETNLEDTNNIKNVFLEIIGYLNEKAKTNYKPFTQSTKRFINARLKEGYTIDDFKTVIDKKTKEWLGTSFEQYLRPETLFGTKFEGYLNANSKVQSSKKPIARDYSKDELDSLFTNLDDVVL